MGIEKELLTYIEKDEEFKKIILDVLEDLEYHYSEDMHNNYTRLTEVLDELDFDSLSDDTKAEFLVLKERMDIYEEAYVNYKLAKDQLQSLTRLIKCL